MKTTLLAILSILSIFALSSCGNSPTSANTTPSSDAPSVTVYYFHGKQRCKTCIAVGNVAKAFIEKNYEGSDFVGFHEVDTSDKANEALVEKYQVSWNALIIAKGDDMIDLTEQAFASAINDPAALEKLIKQAVDARLK